MGPDFDLRQGLALAAETAGSSTPEVQAACLEFIAGRLRSFLVEPENNRYDVVDAVLAAQGTTRPGCARGQELAAWVARPDWNTILPAYARCVRITRDQKQQFTWSRRRWSNRPRKTFYAALKKSKAPRAALARWKIS